MFLGNPWYLRAWGEFGGALHWKRRNINNFKDHRDKITAYPPGCLSYTTGRFFKNQVFTLYVIQAQCPRLVQIETWFVRKIHCICIVYNSKAKNRKRILVVLYYWKIKYLEYFAQCCIIDFSLPSPLEVSILKGFPYYISVEKDIFISGQTTKTICM